MNRLLALLTLLALPVLATAAGGGMHLEKARVDLGNQASLQRGARLYVDLCMGCHSLAYMRWNRLGRDLAISDRLLEDKLLFGDAKPGDRMVVGMKPDEGERWFGVAPPDLSVIARSRGADWLFTYLVSFYEDPDPARPFGVNNRLFDGVAMPNVLWRLQGIQRPVYRETEAEDGHAARKVIEGLELAVPGDMYPGEFRNAMRDLVNFLTYAAEPARLVRERVGVWVLLFLAVLFLLTRALYKEYWKDVH